MVGLDFAVVGPRPLLLDGCEDVIYILERFQNLYLATESGHASIPDENRLIDAAQNVAWVSMEAANIEL